MNKKPIESNAREDNILKQPVCNNCYVIQRRMLKNKSLDRLIVPANEVGKIIERFGMYSSKVVNSTHTIYHSPKIDFLYKLRKHEYPRSKWCKECGSLVEHTAHFKKNINNIEISTTLYPGNELPDKISFKLPSNVKLIKNDKINKLFIYEKYEEKEELEISTSFDINTFGSITIDEKNYIQVSISRTLNTITQPTTISFVFDFSNFENLNNIDEYDVLQSAIYNGDKLIEKYVGFVELNSYLLAHNNTNDIDDAFAPEPELIIQYVKRLYSWGRNQSGQLGLQNNMTSLNPVVVPNIVNPKKIASVKDFVVLLDQDDNLYGWGNNQYGQLGMEYPDNRLNVPKIINKISGNSLVDISIEDISVGWYHTTILDTSGDVWALGRNNLGQLGDGTKDNSFVVVQVQKDDSSQLGNVKSISSNAYYNLALDNDGMVWKWGDRRILNSSDPIKKAEKIPTFTGVNNGMEFLEGINSIATGVYHALVLRDNKTVWGLGYNFSGQVGVGDSKDVVNFQDETKEEYIKFIQVNSVVDIEKIACGAEHSVAINDVGEVFTWGNNDYGQIGNGLITTKAKVNHQYKAFKIKRSIAYVFKTTVQDGGFWSIKIPEQLDLNQYVVGIYAENELGKSNPIEYNLNINDQNISNNAAKDLVSTDNSTGLKVKISRGYTIATINRQPVIKGSSQGTSYNDDIYIVFYLNHFNNVKEIICGAYNNIAIKEDGTVWGWGDNSYNQLLLSSTNVLMPTRIKQLEGKEKIVLGNQFSLYVKKESEE